MISTRLGLLVILACPTMVCEADDVSERAVSAVRGTLQPVSPLSVVVSSLAQQLGQLEAEARAVQALLNQPGGNAPAIVSTRFPHLSALARQAGAEARAVRDQASRENNRELAAQADRIAADNDAISRGMEEARSKAQQATQAATIQLLAGVIGTAAQMRGAVIGGSRDASQGTVGKVWGEGVGSTFSPDLAAISRMLADGKPENEILGVWKRYVTRQVQLRQPLDVQATLQQVTGQAHAQLKARVDADRKRLADKINMMGDDGKLANAELQNVLQKQQQTLQMMSNILKMMHDTAIAIIRKIGG